MLIPLFPRPNSTSSPCSQLPLLKDFTGFSHTEVSLGFKCPPSWTLPCPKLPEVLLLLLHPSLFFFLFISLLTVDFFFKEMVFFVAQAKPKLSM